MRNLLMIVIGVLVVGGGLLGLFLWFTSSKPASTVTAPTSSSTGSNQGQYTTTVTATNPTPITQTSGPSVAAQLGGSIATNDFLKSPNTKTDPNNPGHYFISGATASSSSYSIVYIDSDQSFAITLLEEPLSPARHAAETAILQTLGISPDQACDLRYWVGVPYSIDSSKSGKNLGFSFCPGSTAL